MLRTVDCTVTGKQTGLFTTLVYPDTDSSVVQLQWRRQGGGGPPPPMAGQKNKIDISDFEVSRGLSSPKSPDISTRLRLSTFEHHLLLLPVADLEKGRALQDCV